MIYYVILYNTVTIKMTDRYLHNTGDYECILCDKKYARKFTLDRHIVSIHGFSWDEYLKEICANTTTKECNNTDNIIQCSKCHKTYSTKWNLKKHKETCKGIV